MPRTLSLNTDEALLRNARAAVLNGQEIPAITAARLEARGYNVAAIEQRLIQTNEFKH